MRQPPPPRARALLAAAVAAALAGCAHAPARAPAAPPPLPADVRLAHRVLASGGAAVDDAALAARLTAARAVYVGEEHSNPHHHAAQLELLEALYRIDPSLALGLEMLPRTVQASLDAYVAGTLDEAAFLEQVDWPATWHFDFALYRPLLAFCRAHRLRAYALNVPRELVHAVARRGVAGLSDEERRLLPELVAGPEAHQRRVRAAFDAHPHAGAPGDAAALSARFERFYAAQLLWDEAMAERAAAILAAPDAPARLLVIAGREHVRRYGIPERAARRGLTRWVALLPAGEDEADELARDEETDLVWELLAPR